MEAIILCCAGILLGGASLYLTLLLIGDAVFARFGLYLEADVLTWEGLMMLGAVLLAAVLSAAAPSLKMYTAARMQS